MAPAKKQKAVKMEDLLKKSKEVTSKPEEKAEEVKSTDKKVEKKR